MWNQNLSAEKTNSPKGIFFSSALKGQARAIVYQQKQLSRRLKQLKKPKQSFGRIGNLEVCLATKKKEVKKAQRLRYKVFYKEMSAIPNTQTKMKRRDIDSYDKVCDHLLVLDHNARSRKYPFAPKTKIVGTYRMLTAEKARLNGGFYTQSEYDIAPLIKSKEKTHKFLELGRSCVLKSHRSKRTLELLWRGLWSYINQHQADVIIGCASFEGVDPKEHALALSFLYHYARAPQEWRIKAHAHHNVNMNMLPSSEIDMKKALKAMPPLIKGYLRLGAYVGEGAVIDRQFNTTDILIVLPVDLIKQRYINHFCARGLHQLKAANPANNRRHYHK